ncbi:MAG: nickel pincer cofactor biosynthesis protein LarC [Chloroflexota bacterium]|nr:nickel pincer cofactor biosynthesis protein LarC [Chloroflexota bacterium]
MPRAVCLDCFAGISGDMFAAAFIHAGVISADELGAQLAHLGLGPVEVAAKRVHRGPLAATHIAFSAPQAPARLTPEQFQATVQASQLSPAAKEWVLKAWSSLMEAEAAVHGTSSTDVHLHELGDVDTLWDLASAAAIVERLGPADFYAPRVALGSGWVRTHHGPLPVPAPAVLELLKGFPTVAGDVPMELTTPTGAAILRMLSPSPAWPEASWSAIGHGAGTRELPIPNVLRVLVGEAVAAPQTDQVVLLITDVDDMDPQHFPYVQERLMAAGALDASGETVLMKKGRPGLRFQVISPPHLEVALAEILFRETTTLGIRIIPAQRRILERRFEKVTTPYGEVSVKLGILQGHVVNTAPEYEDCRRLAQAQGVPLKLVHQAAVAAAQAFLPHPRS